MKKLLLSSTLILFSMISHAQIMDEFPEGQPFYKNGLNNLYSDIHDIIMKENLKPCENKNEIYQPRILILKNGQMIVQNDYDKSAVSNNKCAYDISQKILKKLKDWQIATIKEKKIDAFSQFIIYPNDLFENYTPSYNTNDYYIPASYPGGYKKFQQDMHKNLITLLQDYDIQGKLYIDFFVDEKGNITDVKVQPEVFDNLFVMEFKRTLARIKTKWSPATFRGIPIKQRISYIIGFQTKYNLK